MPAGNVASMVFKHSIDVAMGMPSYSESREKGHGVMYSAGKMLLSVAAFEFFAPLAWGVTLAQGAVEAGKATVSIGTNSGKTMGTYYNSNFSARYNDSRNAYTLRQKGLQALQNSSMNGRSVLGSEARSYYRNHID